MYIKRDIDRALEEWRDSPSKKPIILRGVRQCGKTSAVRHLAESFPYYLELNFEKQESLCEIFEGDMDIQKIISRLEIESGVRIVVGETLIFMDEIQVCPRAISALRYFYEELPSLQIIAAGSLLEFVLGRKKDDRYFEFPVGRVRSLFMYPLSFLEFLRGSEMHILVEQLLTNPVSEPSDAHDRLIDLYKVFLITGGMPEVVADYFENKSFLSCQQIHRDIYINMIDDLEKYDELPTDVLRRVFDYCVHNVCSQTKASSAITGISAYYFDEAVRLLNNAGLVYPVKASSCDTLPVGASEKETNKKLIIFDTGIYLTECGLDTGGILGADTFDDINKGDVVEMQTGLELIKYADFYAKRELFYWYRSGASAEVDYVIQQGQSIVPVEVKASKQGGMQSMHSYLKTHPDAPYGIRVSLENYSSYDKIRVLPAYAMCRVGELR